MVWPGKGQWFVEVDGDPLEIAGICLAEADDADPLALAGPMALVADGDAARAVHGHRMVHGGRDAVVGDRVVTFGGLARALLGTDMPGDVVGDLELREIARAVDGAIRGSDQFPLLGSVPAGGSLPRALFRMFRDLRQAGLASRDAGTVASLTALQPEGLGQELVVAMGMFEGTLERLGWPDGMAAQVQAAQRTDRWGDRPLLVVTDGASRPRASASCCI